MQIFAQLRQTEEFGAHVGAAETKRGLAPIVDFERRRDLFVENVSGGIVVDHFYLFELPHFRFRVIYSASGQIIRDNVVVRVLLEDLDIIEHVVAGPKILDEPGARVGPVAKDLSLNEWALTPACDVEEVFPGQ